MKTSNKLLLAAVLVIFISVTASALFFKNALVSGPDAVIVGDGNIITKDIGILKSGRIELRHHSFVLDPHSDRITVTGSSNVLEAYDEYFRNKTFAPPIDWMFSDGDISYYRSLDPSDDPLIFNVGVKGLKDLNLIHGDREADVTFSDTLNLDNFTALLKSSEGIIEYKVNAKKTSIELTRWEMQVKLTGSSDFLYLDIEKECQVDAASFIVKNASVDLGKNSTTNMHVTESLLGSKHEKSELTVQGGAGKEGLLEYDEE